jgi:hypothetical protein
MCGHHAVQAGHGGPLREMVHGMCGCGCSQQRFLSKKEKVEMLKEYRESLKSELEGVEEELKRAQE